MTKDDIIRMAREAGATNVDAADPQCWAGDIAFEEEELERFFHAAYAAGAAAEREACATFLERVVDLSHLNKHRVWQKYTADLLANCATAIRARSKQ
jgi:hypothetical protein